MAACFSACKAKARERCTFLEFERWRRNTRPPRQGRENSFHQVAPIVRLCHRAPVSLHMGPEIVLCSLRSSCSLRNEYGTDYEDYEDILPDEIQFAESSPAATSEALFNRYAAYSAIGGGIGIQVAAASRRPASASPRPSFHGTRPNSPLVDQTTPLLQDNGASHTAVQFKDPHSSAFMPLPVM